jgi:hypothetical protein
LNELGEPEIFTSLLKSFFGIPRLIQKLALDGNDLVKDKEELTGTDNFGVDFELPHDFEIGLEGLVEVVFFLKLVIQFFNKVQLIIDEKLPCRV